MKPEPELGDVLTEDGGHVFLLLPCETQYRGVRDDALSFGSQPRKWLLSLNVR